MQIKCGGENVPPVAESEITIGEGKISSNMFGLADTGSGLNLVNIYHH